MQNFQLDQNKKLYNFLYLYGSFTFPVQKRTYSKNEENYKFQRFLVQSIELQSALGTYITFKQLEI